VNVNQFRNQEGNLPKAHHEFHSVRLERTKQRKLKQIFMKAIMHGVFLSMLFVTAFSNRNLNCFNYQVALRTLISNPKAVKFYHISCLYEWIIEKKTEILIYCSRLFESINYGAGWL
jgi:hypothetical protein